MIRISQPCSSSGQRGRRPVLPESDEWCRGPPCRPKLRCCSPGTCPGLGLHARCGMWLSPLLHLLDDFLQVVSHRWYGLGSQPHCAVSAFPHNDIEFPKLVVLRRKVIAEMRATAFFPFQSSASNDF